MLQLQLSSTRLVADATHQSNYPLPTPGASAAKKPRTSLFDHYSTSTSTVDNSQQYERQLCHYLDTINSVTFDRQSVNLLQICTSSDFSLLQGLFSRVLCAPASSAPVERVFSKSGLLLRPHRARMSDQLLEHLVFLKCNTQL
jgi:hypothetical protein